MSRSRVRPARRGQCQYPSERMLNLGGCTYGTAEQRAEWRRQHVAECKPGRDPAFCSRTAKWQIDGGPHLCALHAGADALEIVMRGLAPPQGPAEETTDMAKRKTGEALGLPDLLEDGQPLANLRGHAKRIADDIRDAAEETGGLPERSHRYLDAVMVVSLVNQLEAIADGRYEHVTTTPAGVE